VTEGENYHTFSLPRKYAKRQMTWFGGKDYVRFIEADQNGCLKNFEEIVNNVESIFFGGDLR
jgi:tRNA A37 N6-isopentenylltransferase MiaA